MAHSVSTATAPLSPPTAVSHRRRQADRTSQVVANDQSRAAQHLLERRSALDAALRPRHESELLSILRRTPPLPAALLMIESKRVRDRFIKILAGAKIELEEASELSDALHRLADRVYVLMFTDRLDLIQKARQLTLGAATHIVYVNSQGEDGYGSGLRAGASDCLTSDARGDAFWAHMMQVRRLADFASSLQLAISDNRILATLDELTRSGSRRFFERQFPREVECAARHASPLGLIIGDIDHFKRVNDEHGHQAGDEVLREFAARVSAHLRECDWLARIGGEEFAVVLPESTALQAQGIAERLRRVVDATPFSTLSGPLHITASFGVCGIERVSGCAATITTAMVRATDDALYASKRAGRNRVTAAAKVAV